MKTTFKPFVFSACRIALAVILFAVASADIAFAQTTYLWTGAGADINWATTGNWSPAGSPGAADTAVFGGATTTGDPTTANNAITADTTVASLIYTNTDSDLWNVTGVPFGVTLTAGNMTVGGLAGNFVTDVAMTDGGTLMVQGDLTVGNLPTSNEKSTLDLSGLSNFVYNASTGTINLGPANYSYTDVILSAVSNNITAGTINDNYSNTSSSSTGTFTFGIGTNIVNVGTFNVAAGRNTTTVQFAGEGGLRIRGVNGTDDSLANMTLGYHNTSGSGSHAAGTLSLNGIPVDIRLGTLTLGRSDHTPTKTSYGSGTVSFDTGTVFVNTVLMAITTGTTASSGTYYSQGIGTINVGANGTLIIGSGGMSLVNQIAGTSATASTGTLNINGGTVICSNSIVKTSTVGTGTVAMSGGNLDMVAGTIGTADNPIDTVTLSSGNLHLNVDGNATEANLNANALSAGGMTITIDSVANVTVPTTIHLINYDASASGDQFGGFTLAPLPAGYTGSLVDHPTSGTIDLTISPAGISVASLLWVGATGGTLNGNWDIGSTANWLDTNGTPTTYADPDFVHFDDSASNATVALSASVAPAAVTFTNDSLNYTITGTGGIGGSTGLFKTGNGSVTLAESGGDNFSGDAIVNAGILIFDDANGAISGGLAIANGATAQIGNNDANGALPSGALDNEGTLIFDRTDDVLVNTAIDGNGALTQNGGGTLTLSAVNTYTGNTTVNHGVLALTGSGAISNSPTITVNNATLDLSAATTPALLQSLNLAGSTVIVGMTNQQSPVVVQSISMSGSGNTVSVTALPPVASYPTTFTLLQSVNGIGGYNLTLGSLPDGYAGSVSLSADNTAVLLTLTSGPIGIRPFVLWSGTNGVSATTNWSDNLNWQSPGAPMPGDNVVFADNGEVFDTPFSVAGDGFGGMVNPGNINNFVDGNFTIGTLTFTNLNSYQNTLLADGAVLSVTNSGSLTVGSGSADFGADTIEYVTIAGTNGTLNVNNTNGTLFVSLGNGSSGNEQAILDLSGLGTFNASVSRFLVGVGGGSAAIPLGRSSGVLYLAKTNVITASVAVSGTETSDTGAAALALDVGDNDSNTGLPCGLLLGQSNAIFADAIGIGRQKSAATLEFNPNLVGGAIVPSAYFRGVSDSAIAVWSLGDGVINSGSGENATGISDFSGGYVNALVDTMYVGRAANNSGGSGTVAGTLTLDDGIISVGTLYDGYQPAAALKTVTGTINVNTNSSLGVNGTLSVSGNLNLALTTAGGTAANGTLNINGGTVQAVAIVAGVNGGISTVNLNGGVLNIGSAGAPNAPLTALNLNGGELQLNLNGAATTNIVATGVTTGSTTVITINSIVNIFSPVTISLISYTGGDPYGSLSLGALPTGYAGNLVDDTAHGLISLQFTTVAPPISYLAISSFNLSGANLIINGTNQGTGIYYVLTSTNVALPLSQWTPVTTNTVSGAGNFTITATNAVLSGASQQFYLLSTTNNH